MFRDETRDKVWNEIRQHDLRAFGKLLTSDVFAEGARRAGVRIGVSALNLANLVWLGVASAMQHSSAFAFVLTTTLKFLEDQEGFSSTSLGKAKRNSRSRKVKRARKSKHHPRSCDPTQVSEEAFCQARQRMPLAFWMAVLTILAERFQHAHARHLYVQGFRLLAMDGTTLNLPRDERLRQHYGTPKNGYRKRAAPQSRVVMITLPGVRIPIAYEVSPQASSELSIAERLLRHIRSNDLVLMDRGFISYGLFWRIQLQGGYFGTRLKKNIQPKRLQKLGSDDWLVQWTPKDSRGHWKELPRSIRLRVIHYHIPGFRASAIVTNVLDPKRLSREDWVRLASDCDDNGKLTPGLYHRRWEIETTYFELKVVLRLKSLRSRTPTSLEYELAGRVVYYLLTRWLIVQAAEKHGLDPLSISFANAVRELEQMRGALITGTPAWVSRELLPRLLDRIASHTVPHRPGRHYPRPDDNKPKRKRDRTREPAYRRKATRKSNRSKTNRRHAAKA